MSELNYNDDITFCVCIVFSLMGEKYDESLRSVFEQDYPNLRFFLLDNACPGFDHAGLTEAIRRNKDEKNIVIISRRNPKQMKGTVIFKQCVEAADGCNFTILCPDERFTSKNILTQASVQLKNNAIFFVPCGFNPVPFFSKGFNSRSFKIDPVIVSIRRALIYSRNKVLLSEANWIVREEPKLNYSRYLMMTSLINILTDIKFNKRIIDSYEMKIQNELLDVISRPLGSRWKIPESECAYALYLQQLLELFEEIRHKEWQNYFSFKKKLELILQQMKNFSQNKVKIVFFTQEYSIWPSLQSFYDACNNDERFIAQLVYIPFNHPNKKNVYIEGQQVPNEEMEPYWKTGYPIMPCTMYDISKESPDVAVFVKPYDMIPMQFYIHEVDKVVRHCIYISYGFETAAWNLDLCFRLPCQHVAWKFIVYGDIVKKFADKVSYNQGKNVVAWGHPRADYYSNVEEKRNSIPEEWKKKIKNRKTVLWNSHHSLNEGAGAGTFFIWKEEVFSYFNNHPDIVLLWRPHPLMFGALVNNRLMTESELNSLIETVEKKDNVILDSSLDYIKSFYASDAIITDGSSFLIEYLYTERPLIFTPKESGGGTYFHDEICDNVYVAREKGDIIKLLDSVRQGIDLMKEKRLSFAKKMLKVNFGGNGEYIKEQIHSELTKECVF